VPHAAAAAPGLAAPRPAPQNGFVFPALAAALAGAGRSSLRFDFAGNGESEVGRAGRRQA
jgi:hypothetical protein